MNEAELAWILSDYDAAGVEPTPRIIDNPASTEGQMMSDDEIAEYIKDAIATLRILADRQSGRYEATYAGFKADLAYLVKLGRMDEDDYNELIHPDNLRF